MKFLLPLLAIFLTLMLFGCTQEDITPNETIEFGVSDFFVCSTEPNEYGECDVRVEGNGNGKVYPTVQVKGYECKDGKIDVKSTIILYKDQTQILNEEYESAKYACQDIDFLYYYANADPETYGGGEYKFVIKLIDKISQKEVTFEQTYKTYKQNLTSGDITTENYSVNNIIGEFYSTAEENYYLAGEKFYPANSEAYDPLIQKAKEIRSTVENLNYSTSKEKEDILFLLDLIDYPEVQEDIDLSSKFGENYVLSNDTLITSYIDNLTFNNTYASNLSIAPCITLQGKINFSEFLTENVILKIEESITKEEKAKTVLEKYSISKEDFAKSLFMGNTQYKTDPTKRALYDKLMNPSKLKEDLEKEISNLSPYCTKLYANNLQLKDCSSLDADYQNDCYLSSMITQNNYDCTKITEQNPKDLCYLFYAMNSYDHTKCKNIDNPDGKIICESSAAEKDRWTYYYDFYDSMPVTVLNSLDRIGTGLVSFYVSSDFDDAFQLKVTTKLKGHTEETSKTIQVDPQTTQTVYLTPKIIDPSSINEVTSADLEIKVEIIGEGELFSDIQTIDIYPKDVVMWEKHLQSGYSSISGTQTLAAYVTPQNEFIKEVISKAVKRTDEGSFTGGIPCSTCSKTDLMLKGIDYAKAIYNTLKEDYGFSYVNSAISYGDPNDFTQTVRLGSDSLQTSNANCIDGAILFASTMENIGLEPYIALIPGHSFVCWTLSSNNGDLVSSGFQCLETTMLGTKDFKTALFYGNKELHEENILENLVFGIKDTELISINSQRTRGITPIE
jgi:hypothetical protein